MPWTPQQLADVYANTYAYRFTCPACGGALVVDRSVQPDAFAHVHCPACDAQHLVGPRNDPLRDSFCQYTDAEKEQIFLADRMRQVPRCPVDGTPLDVHAQRSFGVTSNVTVRCRRCAQTCEFKRLYG